LGGHTLAEGDQITLNGSTGDIYIGELPTEAVDWTKEAVRFFGWADQRARMSVLANADTPAQATTARELGAVGIGLCRTEHMFFEPDRLKSFRKMILASEDVQRQTYVEELRLHQIKDFEGIFKAMNSTSVCVRLLDPPLHEFLPSVDENEEISSLAAELGVRGEELKSRIDQLRETNPMLGHRGCRLGVTFPDVYRMQVRALCSALVRHTKNKGKLTLKIMLPLIMHHVELKILLSDLRKSLETEISGLDKSLRKKVLSQIQWGTMIELPRACLIADQFAKDLDFVSFGTNDLTQTALGISRDDSNKFLPRYMELGIFEEEPFASIDVDGVGQLVRMAVERLRNENPKINIGVCGEHGGDPASIEFFESLGFHSVSCSPFRVPIARLAAARSRIGQARSPRKRKKK